MSSNSLTLVALQDALAAHLAYEAEERLYPTPPAKQGLPGSKSEAVRIEVEAAYGLTIASDAERVGLIDLALAYEGTNLDASITVVLQSIRRGSTPDGLGATLSAILRIREAIGDPGSALRGANDVSDMVRVLEARLIRNDAECRQLITSLRLSESRTSMYRRRTEDAELKLATLKHTIKLRLVPRSTKPFN